MQKTKKFPAHWGPQPQPQLSCIEKLPNGYGSGSPTLAPWIIAHVAIDLLQEVVNEHADHESPNYNHCDEDACKFCIEAVETINHLKGEHQHEDLSEL